MRNLFFVWCCRCTSTFVSYLLFSGNIEDAETILSKALLQDEEQPSPRSRGLLLPPLQVGVEFSLPPCQKLI